ncbi:hypothetical protein [Streptomyces sp. NPDC026659]|uniref:hypothetical protein n=1 Tax=Streptomyces sp. NPDC026659 TaxID=3155123 RepID=UPI0033D46F35
MTAAEREGVAHGGPRHLRDLRDLPGGADGVRAVTGLSADGTLLVTVDGQRLSCTDDLGHGVWSADRETGAPSSGRETGAPSGGRETGAPSGGREAAAPSGPPARIVWGLDGGEFLVLGDGRLDIHDADTGALRTPPEGLATARGARAAAVSPDGLWVAFPRSGGGVTVHHRGSGEDRLLRTADPVADLAWDPLGRRLCLATHSSLQLWNVRAQRLDFSPAGGRPGITAVAWSPDRSLLACADADGVHLLTRDSGTVTATSPLVAGEVLALAFSRTGQFLVCAERGAPVTVYDRALEPVARIPADVHEPHDVSMSAYGRVLVRVPRARDTDEAGQALALWELPDATAPAPRRRSAAGLRRWTAAMCRSIGRSVPAPRTRALAASPPRLLHDAGPALAAPAFAWTGDDDRHVAELRPGLIGLRTPGEEGAVWASAVPTGRDGAHDLAVAPGTDGPVVVATRSGGTALTVLDRSTGALLASVPGGQAPVWSPLGTRELLVPEPVDVPTHLYLYDLRQPEPRPRSRPVAHGTGRPDWSPNGALVAAGTQGGVLLWRMPGFRRTGPRLSLASDTFVARVAWSPDGGLLAATPVAGQGPTVVWDTATWQVHRELGRPGGRGWAPALAWSPDSTMLAAPGPGQDTRAVEVWDVVRGERVLVLEPTGVPVGHVWSVSWSPTGDRIATTYGGGTTLLWDLRTGATPASPDAPLPLPLAALTELAGAAAAAEAAVPLSTLVSVTRLLRTAPPPGAELAHQGRVAAELRSLAWPLAAHPALAAVVASCFPADPRFAPPPGVPTAELRAAVERGLRGGTEEPFPAALSPEVFAASLERVRAEVLPALRMLGPDAIRQDPGIVRRFLRGRYDGGARTRRRPPLTTLRLPNAIGDDLTGPTAAGAPAELVRHGPPDRLVPSQLALPEDVREALRVDDALLYRTRLATAPVAVRNAVLVLDTGAAAHGRVGSCLRVCAHLLAEALLRAGRALELVRLDGRSGPLPLMRQADLVRLWEPHPPAPPDPARATALASAAAGRLVHPTAGMPRVLLLTHPYQPRLELPESLTLRAHYPGHPVLATEPHSWTIDPDVAPERLRAVLAGVLSHL